MMKMASSRVFLVCGLLLAVVVLMAAEVSARDLAEVNQSQEIVKDDHGGHEEHHHGGHEEHHGGGHEEHHHCGHHCGDDGHPLEETEDDHHGGHGGGGHGSHGGGGHGGHHGGHPLEETEDVKN